MHGSFKCVWHMGYGARCKSLERGVKDFNASMGREAIRIIFRGRGQNDPQVTAEGVGAKATATIDLSVVQALHYVVR